MSGFVTFLYGIALALPLTACAVTEKSTDTEGIAQDGRVAAYGNIERLGVKDGQRFLSIDYVQWLSPEECERRVKAGTLDPEEAECDIGYHIVNDDKRATDLGVADQVEITIQRPSRFPQTMSWDELTSLWSRRNEDSRELWDGLWQIHRRDDLVERIEWVYLP